MWFVKVAVGAAVIYAAIVGLMALAQTWLLFPAGLASSGRIVLPGNTQWLSTETPDGIRLQGVHVPAANPPAPDRSVLIGFGGNAWDAEAVAAYLHERFPEHDVIAFHYRGYGSSGGRPSAEAIQEDAVAIYDHVTGPDGPEITDRIITVGFSIGAGPAIRMAARRPLSGTVLVTPFDSLKALAQMHYWWAPVSLLLRHRMEVAQTVETVTTPVAIIAAEHDRVVPPRRTEALRPRVPNLVFDLTVAGAGHNDLYGHPRFIAALGEAVRAIETAHRTDAASMP